MQDTIIFPSKKEYSVNVEDLTFKLIIEKTDSTSTETDLLSNTFHVHSHVEMFVCTKGKISLSTPEGVFELHGGDVALIPPNHPHTRLITTDDETAEWCAISFLFVKRQTKDSKKLYDTFEAVISDDKVVIIFNKHGFCSEIYDVVKTSAECDDILPALRVVTAISGILRDFKNTGNVTQNINHSADIDIVLLYKLNHIINTHFMNELTNSQIAEMLFISERQLSRIAARHYGTSIHHAITDRRLAAAEKLLQDTDKTVESIGAFVGYKSKSGFYRDFRKKYGVTPIEYRRNSTGDNN